MWFMLMLVGGGTDEAGVIYVDASRGGDKKAGVLHVDVSRRGHRCSWRFVG